MQNTLFWLVIQCFAVNAPLKIALVSPDYPPYPFGTGIGTYTKLLAQQLIERGHTVHVVTRGVTTQDESQVSDRFGLHRIGIPRPSVPMELDTLKVVRLAVLSMVDEFRYRQRVAQKLEWLIASEGIQLIEAADSLAEAVLYRPERHPHIPFIVKLHTPLAVGEIFDRNISEPIRQCVRLFERGFLLKASHLTVPSAVPQGFFRQAMGLGNRAIHALPNPSPLGLAGPPSGVEARPDEVLFVGRVTAFKGVFVLVKAIPEILAARPETRFVFVGADATNPHGGGSTIAALQAALPESARDAVRFVGRVPLEEVSGFYARASVCVFPSLFEVFGYTCLEAMALGKAVVGSSNGGMADLLDGGRCGLLYTPPDEHELAAHVLRLLADPSLRAELGERARIRALEDFGNQRVMALTEAFYRRALEECR